VPEEHPIAVVGAGPCGSFAAQTIARQHIPVTVFEEHSTIGLPSHCAGHVGIKGLTKVGIKVPDDIVENQIRGAKFYSPKGHELILDHGSAITYVLDRAKFDLWLADQARRYGVNYLLNSRVTSLTFDKGRHKLRVEGFDHDREMTYRLVVNAGGYPASLLRTKNFTAANPVMTVNGVSAQVDNVTGIDDDFVELYFGREYAPGFFAWIIPKKDGSAKIGLAAKGQDPIRLIHKFISQHPAASEKLRRSSLLGLEVHPIPLGGPIRGTYADGLLIVGDAASQVKPTTGGGIVMGTFCSRIAGETAIEAWKQEDYSKRFLSRYESRWRRAIGKDFLIMSKVRERLNRLSDEKLDCLFELAVKMEIVNDLSSLDDIDFHGSSLLNIAKRPKAIAKLVGFILQTLYL
jgi:digeranylgeranylglycerophospholipid reductase